MSNRLYVGNLSFDSTEHGVRTAFGAFGQVDDVHLVIDRMTGRARGFGFVTMSTADEARNAVEGLNGVALDGRVLRVNEAEERRPRAGGGPGQGGGFGASEGFGGGGGGRGGFGDRGGSRAGGGREGGRRGRW